VRRALALSAAGLLLAAGCIAFLFLLSGRFHFRADLSAGRLYSLSPGSKRILAGLGGPVEIRAYFSKDLPPQYAAVRSYARDLLQEYQDASRGRVRFRFLDIDKDGKEEALKRGIAPIQFNVLSNERFEVREGFMGLVLQHEDKKEVVSAVTDTAGLEYDLTSRILRLTRPSRKVVGLFSGRGALSARRLHPELKEEIERNVELEDADLRTSSATRLSALLVLGPSEKLSTEEVFALDQFLLSGRPLVIAADSRSTDMRSFMSSELDSGLGDFLGHNGVKPGKDFVLDAQCQKVSVAQQRGWFTLTNIVDYPFFIAASDLSKSHPATRDLNSLSLPFASALEVAPRPAGASMEVLARSSKGSWLSRPASGPYSNISPIRNDSAYAPGDRKGPFILAVSIEDRFTSFFSRSPSSPRPVPAKADRSAFLSESRGNGRLLVVGTSRFADMEISRGGGSGAVFLLNLFDWAALDPDLCSIRSKSAAFRPLMEAPPSVKAAARWGNILIPPAFAVAFGLLRLGLRRRARARRLALYSPHDAA
jgi:ABC-type uncharacterized transport system involved in gliding motility auxiliary subunit